MGRLTTTVGENIFIKKVINESCESVCFNEYDCRECPIQEAFEKLAHYEDLEEQGKLVLFPIYAYFIKDRKVYEGWVQETVHAVSRKPLYDIRYDDKSLANYRGYLGNTVFLTKEEAEAKLKEMRGAE